MKVTVLSTLIAVFSIISLSSNAIAQTTKEVKINDLESELKSFNDNVYIGISDPNLQKEAAISQSTGRAYLIYAIFNGLDIKSSSNGDINKIENESKNEYSEDYKSNIDIELARKETPNCKVVKHIFVSKTGECITFLEAEGVSNNFYNGSIGIKLNHISKGSSNIVNETIYEYFYASNNYYETYKYGSLINSITGNYKPSEKGQVVKINLSKVPYYKNNKQKGLDYQYNTHTSSLDYGLWNAFVNCVFNDVYRISILKNITERYANLKDNSFNFFTNQVEKDSSLYSIGKINLKGVYFSQFGLNLDLDFIEKNNENEGKLKVIYDKEKFINQFEDEMKK